VLGGASAAWALGLRPAILNDRVEVVQPVGHRLRSRPELRVRRDRLVVGEVVQTTFGPATSAARTAFDLARRGGLLRSVAALDAMLRVTGVGIEEVFAVATAHPGVRGLRLAAQAMPLADSRSESPRESMLRVVLVRAELTAPVPQFDVRDCGRFVARLDLA